jgi:hypothetical protein
MWRITVGKSSEKAEKLPSWQIKFEQVVENRSLSVYEEVA